MRRANTTPRCRSSPATAWRRSRSVAEDDGGCGLGSLVSFNAIPGTTYSIRVGGYGSQPGTFQLAYPEGWSSDTDGDTVANGDDNCPTARTQTRRTRTATASATPATPTPTVTRRERRRQLPDRKQHRPGRPGQRRRRRRLRPEHRTKLLGRHRLAELAQGGRREEAAPAGDLSGATDPDGDALAFHIDGVSQDEQVTGTSDSTTPDAQLTAAGADSDKVLLRAEANPNGNGRVYRVSYTVSDGTEDCSGIAKVAVTPATAKTKGQADSARRRRQHRKLRLVPAGAALP